MISSRFLVDFIQTNIARVNYQKPHPPQSNAESHCTCKNDDSLQIAEK